MEKKQTPDTRFDRKTLILTVVAALLVIAIIVIAVVLLQRSGASGYEESYGAALELYAAGDYSGALAEAQSALSEEATEDAAVLVARCHAMLGDYASAVAALESWVNAHGSGSEAGALLEQYREEAGVTESEPPEDTVTIAGREIEKTADTVVFTDTPLSADDLAAIASLEELTNLSLNGCSLTDISALAQCAKLTTLSLEDNELTDISPLASLRSLKSLYLSGNEGLGSLEPLYRLDALTTLDIRGRAISEEEFDALSAELPGCSILSDTPAASASEITLGGLTFTSDVTELDLSGRQISDISALAECTALEKLNLSGNVLSSISALASLPKLKQLDLSNNEISNISPLMALTGLKTLDLSGNAVGNIAALSGHSALTSLKLDGNPVESLSPLSGLTGLRSLSLRETGLTDGELSPLLTLTGLTSLDISGNADITAAAADSLRASLPGCEITMPAEAYSVTLGGVSFASDSAQVDASGLGVTSLAGVEHFTALQVLVLNRNPGIDISNAPALTTLGVLELNECALADISALSTLTQLTSLSLIGNELTDISALRHLTGLTELHLSLNEQLADITPLAGLTGLKTLSLNGTAVTELGALTALISLETLDLEGCAVSDLTPLYSLKNLKTLYAAGCGLSAEQIDALGEALPGCTIYT